MATRSLGQLTLDLIAKIGGFTQGMTEAERVADRKQREIAQKAKARSKEASDAWGAATKLIGGAFLGIGVASLIRSISEASADAINTQAQLSAALRSTGEAAGYSQEQLNDLATGLSSVTTFDDDDIVKAGTALLKYTNIVGKEYSEALKLAADRAARLGVDLTQSADDIGKALNSPAEGLSRLRKEGVAFTDAQKGVIESLVESGRTADAQRMILAALETSYGGAAVAARGTFGGAIEALRVQVGNLIEGDQGSLQGATDAVNSLTKTLGSEETKAAFAAIIGAFAQLIEWTSKATTETLSFSKFVGETLAKAVHGSADPIERLNEQIAGLGESLADVNGTIERAPWFIGAKGMDDLRERAKQLTAQLKAAKGMRDALVAGSNATPPASKPGTAPTVAPTPTAPKKPADSTIGSPRKAAREVDPLADAKRYLETLKRQLQATKDLSAEESLLADIQAGRLGKVTPELDEQLRATARLIDEQKVGKEAEKEAEEFFRKVSDEAAQKDRAREKGRAEAGALLIADDPIAQLKAQLDERLKTLDDYAAIDAENAALYAEAKIAAEKSTQDRITEIQLSAEAQRAAAQRAEYEHYLASAVYFLDDLSQLQSSNNDKMARIGKAAAIANTIVKTYESATSAYAALAGIPVVGPALGAAAAAAAIVAGMANVQAIRSAGYGGGRVAGGPVSEGSAYRVGESGVEMFVAPQSGFIVPNQLTNALSEGAGAAHNYNITIAPPIGMDSRTASQFAREAARQIAIVTSRGSV